MANTTSIHFFEENNRLYVEIENPPKGIKEKLAEMAIFAIAEQLEGLVPKESVEKTAPEKTTAEELAADGFEPADGPVPFAGPNDSEPEEKPAKLSKPAKSAAELAADDDWA